MDLIDILVEIEREVDPISLEVDRLKNDAIDLVQNGLDAEPRESGLIDEICASYAENRVWPINMTPVQTFLIYGRLAQAAYFLQFLADNQVGHAFENPQFDVTPQSKATLYKFLLIDYWNFAGRARWGR